MTIWMGNHHLNIFLNFSVSGSINIIDTSVILYYVWITVTIYDASGDHHRLTFLIFGITVLLGDQDLFVLIGMI